MPQIITFPAPCSLDASSNKITHVKLCFIRKHQFFYLGPSVFHENERFLPRRSKLFSFTRQQTVYTEMSTFLSSFLISSTTLNGSCTESCTILPVVFLGQPPLGTLSTHPFCRRSLIDLILIAKNIA